MLTLDMRLSLRVITSPTTAVFFLFADARRGIIRTNKYMPLETMLSQPYKPSVVIRKVYRVKKLLIIIMLCFSANTVEYHRLKQSVAVF